MRNVKILLTLSLCSLLLGCGGLPEPNHEVVHNFTPESIPEGKDVGVYLIRPNLFQGGGRTFWVSKDSNNIGRLSNGKYLFLPLNSKEDLTINTHMDGILWSPFEVPEPTDEKKYFYVKVSLLDKKAEFIDPDVAITAISSMSNNKLIESRERGSKNNPGFDNIVMNPAFVTEFMQDATQDIRPDNEHGVVYIIRPKNTDPASFWIDGTYAGNLIEKQYLRLKLPVGKHYIYKRDSDFNLLEIDIKPNSKYFLSVKQTMGWGTLNNTPVALNANKSKTKIEIDTWLSTFNEVKLAPENDLTLRQKKHITRGENFIRDWNLEFNESMEEFPQEYSYKDE